MCPQRSYPRGLLLGLLFLIFAAPASAALIKSYDFNGNFADTLGNGSDLVPFGGTISGGRYIFGFNQGLGLDSALPSTSNYAIEFKFEMTDDPTFWNKLIDFEDQTSDIGLYVGGDRLRFFNDTAGGPDPIPLNTDVVVTLTRNGATNEVAGLRTNVRHLLVREVPRHGAVRSAGDQFPNKGDIQNVCRDVGEVELSRPVRITLARHFVGQHGVLDDPRGSSHINENSHLLGVADFAHDLTADR